MALNILVVDDSAVMREIIKKTLSMSDIPVGTVFEAGDGEEGLEILDDNWIDLALIDIHMPIMSGETMIKEIRENPETADLAIIVVSSESDSKRIRVLEKKGAKFVHKPFTPEILSKEVTLMLGEVSDE